MMSATQNFNVNVSSMTGVGGVSRNIRDAALLVQNGYAQPHNAGAKFTVAANTPATMVHAQNSMQPLPFKPNVPNGTGPRTTALANHDQLSLPHASYARPEVNGHAPRSQPPQSAPTATQPGSAPRPSATALQKSFLQQQVERFVQQQAAQQGSRPAEAPSAPTLAPYVLPVSHSTPSLGSHPRPTSNGSVNKQQFAPPGARLNGPHLIAPNRMEQPGLQQPSPAVQHLNNNNNGLRNMNPAPTSSELPHPMPHPQTAFSAQTVPAREPHPAASARQPTATHADGDTRNAPHGVGTGTGTGNNTSTNGMRTTTNDTVSFSLVGSRHVRNASLSTQPAPNYNPNPNPSSTPTSNPNNGANGNANANSDRNRPLIYAPRSVIADTYLKQERGDCKGQSQRFLDMMNHIRMQQAAATGDSASGSIRVSVNMLPQPDYNYVVDQVDKVHVRSNSVRNMHRRASITDSAEDVRRISDALTHKGIQRPFSSINAPTLAVSLANPTPLAGSDSEEGASNSSKSDSYTNTHSQPVRSHDDASRPRSILKSVGATSRSGRRVTIDPLALLLDASLEGELDVVRAMCSLVTDASVPNDEGITALHNAVCAGHVEICRFLIQSAAANVNAADADGWTPLHCAASCNNLELVRLLVENGACLGSITTDEHETPLDKCEPESTSFPDGPSSPESSPDSQRDPSTAIDTVRFRPQKRHETCLSYLLSVMARLGVANDARVYSLFQFDATSAEELSVALNEPLVVVRRPSDDEWWLVRNREGREGYIPRSYLGLYPRMLKQT